MSFATDRSEQLKLEVGQVRSGGFQADGVQITVASAVYAGQGVHPGQDRAASEDRFSKSVRKNHDFFQKPKTFPT